MGVKVKLEDVIRENRGMDPDRAFDILMRRFKKKVEESGILKEHNKNRFYEKPSVKRNKKHIAAIKQYKRDAKKKEEREEREERRKIRLRRQNRLSRPNNPRAGNRPIHRLAVNNSVTNKLATDKSIERKPKIDSPQNKDYKQKNYKQKDYRQIQKDLREKSLSSKLGGKFEKKPIVSSSKK